MTATRGFEKVINYVLELIQSGNLKIGSELPSERQLTNILELSRNSVREGLRSLEDMGIIKSLHGSGNMQRSFESMILQIHKYERNNFFQKKHRIVSI